MNLLLFIFTFPNIAKPTTNRDSSNTLIDNIFSNRLIDMISGNLRASISNHLPQFIILPNTKYFL